MKVYVTCFALLLFSFCNWAQDNNELPGSIEYRAFSKILGEERQVLIHLPPGNGARESYPVLYLLDGASNFKHVVGLTEYLSEAGLCPPIAVVGVLHPNRMLDLTFGTDADYPELIGKGEEFVTYLETELMPYIESTYATAPYKIFMGHSVGGLSVAHTLIHRPSAFHAYVSLDGALWWDNQKIVEEAKLGLATKDYKGKTLFMALANRMERGVDTLAVQKDTSEHTELIRSNLALVKHISKNKQNGLRFKHTYYEADDHGSIRLIGAYDALRFIFDFYKLKIYNSEFDDPAFKLDSLVAAHYNKVSEALGYTVKPNESQVNNLAYGLLHQKQFDRAEALFKLNIASYPDTANCYDGMGDLYLAKGDKTKAIEYFKRTLSLQEIPASKVKLEALLSNE